MSNPIKELYKSSLELLTPLSLPQTYKIIVAEATKLVDGAGGSVILAERGIMRRVYSSDSRIKTINPQRYGRTYNSYKNKMTITLTAKDIVKVHPEFAELRITSYILIPLINKGKSIGVLSIYKNKDPKFSYGDKEKLENFSAMASIAIKKAQLYAELHTAIESRDLFLSLASHELKTPITTIYVYLQLMQRNMKNHKKFDPEWIETLINEMVRLTKIIDELMELSKIRSGKLTYELKETDIKLVVKRALLNFRASHDHLVEYENKLDEDKSIVADFDKLVGVVINILDNAAKHSPASSPVKFTLDSNHDFIKLSIRDFGQGIEKEEIKKIFNEFYKAENNTRPGMGLGLFLARQIIKAHKGKIKIASSVGRGTQISIYLPLIRTA